MSFIANWWNGSRVEPISTERINAEQARALSEPSLAKAKQKRVSRELGDAYAAVREAIECNRESASVEYHLCDETIARLQDDDHYTCVLDNCESDTCIGPGSYPNETKLVYPTRISWVKKASQ